MNVYFKRVRWNEMEHELPAWAAKYFDGTTKEDLDKFDIAVVHMLDPFIDGEIKEWATVDQVLQSIKEYNSQFEPEGFNDNPAHVAYSLLKCVEAGMAKIKVE